MRVLVLGGTKFIGPPTVRRLVARGHEVTLFHRGQTHADLDVPRIHGDRANLRDFRFDGFDAVLDMFCYTTTDAEVFADMFRGQRTIVCSSADVYLAFGRLHGTETGPPQELPLTEDSALRETDAPSGPKYDKVGVERIVMNDACTVLRLPATYGPRDPLHRLFAWVKRIDDGREVIVLNEDAARWRWVRGYVENVAEAIALAVTDPRAAGRIYNVADPDAVPLADWVRLVGDAAGWDGEVAVVPGARYKNPVYDADFSQDYVVDSTRIREELGYAEVVDRDEALRTTIAWERANPPDEIDPAHFDYDAEDAAL